MLIHLSIKDFAIVSQAAIDFHPNMTVITGETGSGKSILLDALSVALGERADSQLIRPHADYAEVTAIFDISNVPDAVLWLTDFELTNEDSLKECIIRRILYPQGRSRAMINGRVVTSAQLKLLGEFLVQIHGQHQHQRLLKSHEQLRLLDAFSQQESLCHQVMKAYHQWESLYTLQQALMDNAKHQAQLDLLTYQIAELEPLASDVAQLKALYQEHDRLIHAKEDAALLQQLSDKLAHYDEGNILQWLTQLQQGLRGMLSREPRLSETMALLEAAEIQLREASSDILHYSQAIEMDPERLEQLERIIEKIHDMARKHKVEPLQLQTHCEKLMAEKAKYEKCENELAQITVQLQEAKKQYQHYAKQLTQVRQKAKIQLEKEVTLALHQFAMPGAVFSITLLPIENDEPKVHGQETVCFEISANVGHGVQPLNKVASGGELSRISLAIELILAKYLATPCLIFDEVDVGVSGKIGALIGKALRQLGQSTQVLCITHLPQVAALASHHLQVRKVPCEKETLTEIKPLTQEERINEIAQMLGGMELTHQAKANAKALMET